MSENKSDDEYMKMVEFMCMKALERASICSPVSKNNLNSEDSSGWTPLFIAAASNQTKPIEDLIYQGADVNHQCSGNGWTALTNASYWGHYECVILLLSYGADPLLKSEDGLTAIDIATRMQRKNVLIVFNKYFELKKAA
ncbi:MAG: ankyrin repeat domain-containing protein [Bdellovibrionales bacterium]|nr:ankyrin repeat domain-containing protein [Bdellovibrionales bacterium]